MTIRYFFIIIFYTFSLHANDNTQIKILEYIINNINHPSIHKVWSDDTALKLSLEKSGRYITVSNSSKADLIILQNKNSLPLSIKNKAIFVLNYKLLKEIPQSFGAFFWKKGRPNIVFIKPRLKKVQLQLSNNLKKYEEEKIW